MFLSGFAINKDIIYIDQTALVKIILEHFVDIALKGRQTVTESKRHNLVLIQAKLSLKIREVIVLVCSKSNTVKGMLNIDL